MNYAIMLTLWSAIYLLRSEFNRRRYAEISHWQLQVQLKENELQFLRSQINSHFLFNAINNLRALINEDAERARAGLADLSVLLRGLLQNDGAQLVSLREEMEWVRGYLALESLQFEDRLHLDIQVDESLLTAKLPPLIIQTLVENAIKHGIAARRAGGTLQIRIKRIGSDHWQINVVNPLPEFQPSHQGNKIGLHNARERLGMAFGEAAQLDLHIANEVTASVSMPL
jgi:LytS/YehU family sensor histidine kinase